MADSSRVPDRSDDTLLRALVEGTAGETGEAFFRALVRNAARALAAAGGKVAGEGGAAERVGIPPSTFRSRMKALGLERPRAG